MMNRAAPRWLLSVSHWAPERVYEVTSPGITMSRRRVENVASKTMSPKVSLAPLFCRTHSKVGALPESMIAEPMRSPMGWGETAYSSKIAP
jgi:hypothetical protein